MNLKLRVDKAGWESLSEGIREFYEEKDGEYLLSVEGIEDTTGLKNATVAARKERDALKTQIKAWEALGATPEEISELLKKKEPEKKPDDPKNPANEQLEKLRKEMDALRADTAATQQALRLERIEKQFADYPDAQKALLVGLVNGTTAEEIAESVKTLKEAFPVKPAGGVGGPSNPPTRKETDDAAAKYGKERAEAQSKGDKSNEFKTI